MADYVTTFFPNMEPDQDSVSRQMKVKIAVNFVAHDLWKNAIKFSDKSSTYQIK
ncbi:MULTISPECIES: hypothetical protein [Limnospira]|uniref:Uncharacterized protein n=2 Tax=Limnospira TaxID=2596745 RepID=B5W0P4_LIMMA|nr:hypothetical protein [Limnospira indica]EDZ94932.1 conserved hypothetical protein [Limnospira maxima CS-328]MDT9237761.1 hypothetical protein [Limnospira sp. PMC 1261.20]QJB26697.1 hypothetical protein HFV01_13885 [Limnospira fusiformis SAG 85.79]UWU48856.1 hypothetical protein APLC1_3660 [Arthrospira platensis C1]